MERILQKNIENLPKAPGVYFLKNYEGKIIYIGKATSLAQRVKTYFAPNLDIKTRTIVSKVKDVGFIRVFSEFEGLLLEAALIKKYQPKYNIRLKDDKSFLYIVITSEEFPKVFSARKNDITSPKYIFGPFPSAKTVRQVLSFLRRIFPFCNQKSQKRPCFWSNLGLCHPCPGEIANFTGKEREAKKEAYLANIRNLVSVLRGRSRRLIEDLTSQMRKAAKNQEFETAAYILGQIKKLKLLTSSHLPISFYLENAGIFEEEMEKDLVSLHKLLTSLKIGGASYPSRIECYDVSNIFGQYASGGMVVFQEGIEKKDNYRRFKIKISGKPNDTAMLAEVLKRRLKHKEWEYPNLIIVDGGKGQVSGTIDVLNNFGLNIPIIGLAKRLETLIVPKLKTETGKLKIIGFRKLNLSKNERALKLLQRIRDEAHRFALAYHLKLRRFI